MTRLILASGALALCLASTTATAETADVKIKLFQFQPGNLEIAAGASVRWTNGDDIEHSITAGALGKENGAFDSGFLAKAGSFEHGFATPGTISYFCKRHPSMTGTVTVR